MSKRIVLRLAPFAMVALAACNNITAPAPDPAPPSAQIQFADKASREPRHRIAKAEQMTPVPSMGGGTEHRVAPERIKDRMAPVEGREAGAPRP
jgi:hypothetical protein